MTKVFKGVTFDEDIFTSYMQEKEVVNTHILASGIIVDDPRMTITSNESYTGTIPVYLSASAESEALNFDGVVDNVPSEIGNKVQTYVATARMKAWKESSFLRYLLNAKSPLQNMADNLVGKYYELQWKKTILSIVRGVLANTNMASHKTHIASMANLDMFTSISDLKQKACGDLMDSFGLAIMHSKIYNELVKQEVIQFAKYTLPNAIEIENVPVIGGCVVISDDDCKTGTNYECYLIGREAILRAPKAVDTPYHLGYDPKTGGGAHEIYTKQAQIFHPNGFSFDITKMASMSPTNAELATGANWNLVFNNKLAPFALLTIGE